MRSNLVHVTSNITRLSKSGRIKCARKLFDGMPVRDTIAWNAMLSAYSHLGLYEETLLLFHQMRAGNVKADHFTFTSALSACSDLNHLQIGQKVHAFAIFSGHNHYLPVNNALIHMYGKCFIAEDATKLFEEMGCRNEVSWCSLLFAYVNVGCLDAASSFFDALPGRAVVAWNTMIAGYAKWGRAECCLHLFNKMLEDSCRPDQWTLSAIMNACAEIGEIFCGRMVQGFVVRSGWSSAVEVYNSIISFYATFGYEQDVLKAVDNVGMLNQVSWNAIIDAHMKTGNAQMALSAFQHAPEKNLISWTSMIAGYVRNGLGEYAARYFVHMIRSGLRPDEFSFGAVLNASSHLGMLGLGKIVHGFVVKTGFYGYAYIGNGLVNTYAKCGDIMSSHKAFIDLNAKDLISWNSMLYAFGLHGCSVQALHLFEDMLACGVKPDKLTFIGLLMTCSHLGLIAEGRAFFESMHSVYGLSPEIDHMACMVDMLGRRGKLDEARELVNRYTQTYNVEMRSLEALLGSCSTQGDLQMGLYLGGQLQNLNPRSEMSYVLLSNLYSATGQWREAEMVRKAMALQGVKKIPGYSWIEVQNEVIVSVSGRSLFLHMEEVQEILDILESEMRQPWFTVGWVGFT